MSAAVASAGSAAGPSVRGGVVGHLPGLRHMPLQRGSALGSPTVPR